MAIISNGTTIADAGSFASGLVNADQVLIKELTASSSANLTFLHGTSSVVLDGTYPIYKFVCTSIHPATDNTDLLVKFRDGGSNYDATCTATMFSSRLAEDNSDYGLGIEASQDEAQATGGVKLSVGLGTANDECTSGEMYLFSPSNTIFVKHFIAHFPVVHHAEYSYNWWKSGYANVTAAIDGVQFAMSSGNIDAGTIKLYGLKDS